MKIAYFINCYPQASHSFIRREIAALESLSQPIQRVSIRRPTAVVDPADRAELLKTFIFFDHLIQIFILGILWAFRHPLTSIRAKFRALRMGYRAGSIFKHLIYCHEAFALAKWSVNNGINHIHAHFGTNSASVAMLAHLAGGPTYSLTIHGPEEFDSPIALALGEKVRHATFVAAISQFARSQLLRWTQTQDWPKIHVIHCGVDADFLNIEATPPSAEPTLVCVGRLCEQKGQMLLLRAAAEVIKSGTPLELLLVGDGPMRTDIQKLLATLGIGLHVRITGWQSNSEVRKHILNSRALVLPSFAEGLPVVIMESLALGRPVISTYVAGIPELVENGKSGWLVPAGDVEAAASAIRQALTAPQEQLTAMGQTGQAKVRQNHNCQIEAQSLLSLLKASIRNSAKISSDVTAPATTCASLNV